MVGRDGEMVGRAHQKLYQVEILADLRQRGLCSEHCRRQIDRLGVEPVFPLDFCLLAAPQLGTHLGTHLFCSKAFLANAQSECVSTRIHKLQHESQSTLAMAVTTSRSATSPSVSASSAVPSTSTISTFVESTKDGDPPTVRFTNTQHLFDVINSTAGDFLIVTSIVFPLFLSNCPLGTQYPSSEFGMVNDIPALRIYQYMAITVLVSQYNAYHIT